LIRPVAAGIARMSLFGIAVFGLALVIYLSTHGFDRAVLLIPDLAAAGRVDYGSGSGDPWPRHE
jgi:hypothetical protein